MAIAIGFQRELSALTYLMSGSHLTLGKVGELYAKIACDANGMLAEIDHKRLNGDLSVTLPSGQVLRIEVKTARLNSRKQFCFTLWKRRNGMTFTDCSSVDAVMLIAVRPSGMCHLFVIPGQALQNTKAITLPDPLTPHRSKYAIYRQYLDSLNFRQIEALKREIDGL